MTILWHSMPIPQSHRIWEGTETALRQKFSKNRPISQWFCSNVALHSSTLCLCQMLQMYNVVCTPTSNIWILDWKHWTFNSEGTIMKPTHWWRSTVAFLNNAFDPFDLCYARYQYDAKWLMYERYSISQEKCTRFLLCCALLWLYIDWFSHIHQAYFTGTVAIYRLPQCQQSNPNEYG